MNFSMLGSARAATSNLNGLAEALQQAVVEVRSGETASGTGIIWGGAGLVVTNAHCIRRGASVQVIAGGKWREAHALAYHPHHDLALLAAPSVTGPLLELRDPNRCAPASSFSRTGIRSASGTRWRWACCTPSLATNQDLRAGSSPTYGSHPAIRVVPSSMRKDGSSASTAWSSTDLASRCLHHWCSDSWSGRCHSARRNSFSWR